MVRASVLIAACSVVLTACASSTAIRTSANTAIIRTSAAPACGGNGAARVAQTQAAVETIKAGYDRYLIEGAAAANNVSVSQGPGSFNTVGTANVYGNYGVYNSTTTYTPGPAIYSGSHDQAFAIRMFKNGEPGASQAIPARDTLGPEWEKLVAQGGPKTCS